VARHAEHAYEVPATVQAPEGIRGPGAAEIARTGQFRGGLERRQRLNELDFVWDPFEADCEEGFSHLKVYKEREGHCRVPDGHVERGFRLGGWTTKQRLKRTSCLGHSTSFSLVEPAGFRLGVTLWVRPRITPIIF
jgi:hypothetical protein